MRASIQITTHCAKRLHERVGIEQPLQALQVLQSRLSELTAHIGQESNEAGEQCSFKLFYIPSANAFAVLVIKTVLEAPGIPAFHIIKTTLSVDMYERKFNRVIEQRCFKRAARQRLTPVEYREWIQARYGAHKKPNNNQLYVVFRQEARRKSIGIKIRQALCPEFKRNERIEDSLAHPGALTKVHEVLDQFGFKLEDRMFMRFDSEHGQLKMEARTAHDCPYCGMKPLSSDLPDTKGEEIPAHQ